MVLKETVTSFCCSCMVFLNISQTVVFADTKNSSAIADIKNISAIDIIANPDQATKYFLQ